MKDILIISCGPGLKAVRDDYGHAIEWIQSRVDKTKFNFSSIDAYRGELPSYTDGDAWIITGSSFSTYEDKEWIVEMEHCINKAVSVGKPILGICFGHQLIAQSLGGKVEKNPKVWDLGSYPMIKTIKHHLFNEINLDEYFYNSHQDVVTELPEGSKPLAYNQMGNQAFHIGKWIYGVQFHPEFSHDIIKKYVEVRKSMGADVINPIIQKSDSSYLIINNFLKIV